MTIDYHLWSVMDSLLIFKYNISHGTMKYTLQAHVYYYVFKNVDLKTGFLRIFFCFLKIYRSQPDYCAY
jgi:hypothetical protein